MTDIVNALLVKDGRILLARRGAHRKTYPDLWSFPGGHVDPGETLAAALAREMREEIGVTPTDFAKIAEIGDPANVQVRYHLFTVRDWTGGTPTLRGDEHIELRWCTPAEAGDLPDLALPAYRAIFRDLNFATH